MSSNGAHIPQT